MPKTALQLDTMIYVWQTCYMFRPCRPIFREVVYNYLTAWNTDNIKLTPSFTLRKLHTLIGKTKKDENMLDINFGTAEARLTNDNLVHILMGNYI
jgi:hypothetical protein